MEKSLDVLGTAVPVVDGWVSVKRLCTALRLPSFERQREKVSRTFLTKRLKMHSGNGRYVQVCIKEADALRFIKMQGLWTRGRYRQIK